MEQTQTFTVKGHKNLLATHRSTIEFTTEDFLTKNGDCIVGINSTLSMPQLPQNFKNALKDDNAKLEITIETATSKESFTAKGSKDLTFEDPHAMIIRKSDFICPRTLCINSQKAAIDLDRKLIEELGSDNDEAKVTLKIIS